MTRCKWCGELITGTPLVLIDKSRGTSTILCSRHMEKSTRVYQKCFLCGGEIVDGDGHHKMEDERGHEIYYCSGCVKEGVKDVAV